VQEGVREQTKVKEEYVDQEKVSLATVGGGAAIERFDIALQQVINNILDVNTDARKERSVTLKVTFKPTEKRDMGAVSVDVVPKLAPVSAFKTQVFLGTDATGKGMACEMDINQMNLFPKKGDNFKILKGGEKP
jgi:hypothetical protein